MSTFNTIFSIVRNRCKAGAISGNTGFRAIAADAGIQEERVHFYLDCLQAVGVIEYHSSEKKIVLTEKGKATSRIFPN